MYVFIFLFSVVILSFYRRCLEMDGCHSCSYIKYNKTCHMITEQPETTTFNNVWINCNVLVHISRHSYQIYQIILCPPEREGLLVTLWLTESSAYRTWQSIMVSHTAVDQLISWDSSINMSLNCAVDQLLYGIPSYTVRIYMQSSESTTELQGGHCQPLTSLTG